MSDQSYEELLLRFEQEGKRSMQTNIDVMKMLKHGYLEKIRPLEEAYRFDLFSRPFLQEADFDAKPFVLLLGQYSVGKTTFIRHLIKQDYPGMRIGPEPTTDKFECVMYGKENAVIPGHALTADATQPFYSLEKFGSAFLERLEASHCNSKLLESISFIDTPGVLSGEKHRTGREYDYPSVVEWFAQHSDRILLLFDAHKLDISDEFRSVIEACHGNEDKIRIVLNKSDSISPPELLRVYGALMWSLGKVIKRPEVSRVYIGSFTDDSVKNHEKNELFASEKLDLLTDLLTLQKNAGVRKVNEVLKRVRLLKVHITILNSLREKLPRYFGRERKKKDILNDLPRNFTQFRISEQEMPSPVLYKEILETMDVLLLKEPQSQQLVENLNAFLTKDVPLMMRMLNNTLQGETLKLSQSKL